MPVHKVLKKGKLVGYQWGSQKIYTVSKFGVKKAKKKAQLQGMAINISRMLGR